MSDLIRALFDIIPFQISSLLLTHLCLCCYSEKMNIEKTNKAREKRSGILILQSALSQIASTTSDLSSAYSNNELQNIGDVALTIVKSVPIVGDVVGLLTSSPEEKVKIASELTSINNHLAALNREIINVGSLVNKISKQLDLSLIQKQVADDVRVITNCHSNFLLFLEKPTMIAEQDRLIACYDKFGYIREIGNILNDEKVTFSQKPLFDQIIDITTFCNGSRINSVYKYLLGVYVEGCIAVTTAEAIKYNQTSTTFKDICEKTIKKSQEHLLTIYEKCAAESCDKLKYIVSFLSNYSDTNLISKRLNETLPWFHLSVLLFKPNTAAKQNFFDGKVNYVVVTNKVFTHRIILWSTDENQYSSGPNKYGVEYNENAYHDRLNGLNLIHEHQSHSQRSSLFGFYAGGYTTKAVCKESIDLTDLRYPVFTKTSITVEYDSKVLTISLSVAGAVCLVLVLVGLCAKCRG